MPHVLVTGASGFIGTNLVEALIGRGEEVVCLARPTSATASLQKLGSQIAIGDITDPASLSAAIANADIVYHLAGLTKANSLAEFRSCNELGVRNMVEACARRTTPPVVIVVSSLAAAGPMKDRRARTEHDPIGPASNYGRSKRAGEMAAETFAKQVPITVIRPPIVLGPGDVAGLAMFRSIRRFRSFTTLRKAHLMSVVHVADLVPALIAAAERGERLSGSESQSQGYYFVASNEQPTFAELGRMVAKAVGRPYAWQIRVPIALLWIVATMGEAMGQITRRPRYLNWDRARDFAGGHWACSAEKAKRQLAFAVAAPLEERIRQTAKWYRDHGWLKSIESSWPVPEETVGESQL